MIDYVGATIGAASNFMVRTFVGFWASDPVVIRRLRAMAALDPEIGAGIRTRDARRPNIAREILKRAPTGKTKQSNVQKGVIADVLGMLTSFETYDLLSRAGHRDEEILATLIRLAHCASDSLLRRAGRRVRS
jgi:hypothetical protein